MHGDDVALVDTDVVNLVAIIGSAAYRFLSSPASTPHIVTWIHVTSDLMLDVVCFVVINPPPSPFPLDNSHKISSST